MNIYDLAGIMLGLICFHKFFWMREAARPSEFDGEEKRSVKRAVRKGFFCLLVVALIVFCAYQSGQVYIGVFFVILACVFGFVLIRTRAAKTVWDGPAGVRDAVCRTRKVICRRMYATALSFVFGVLVFVFTVERLPDSISHEVLWSGKHLYRIRGLYLDEKKGFDSYSYYEMLIPFCVSCLGTTEKKEMEFHTWLAVPQLCKCVNRLAGGGRVPYWNELNIRDRKSSGFDECLYELVYEEPITVALSSPGLLTYVKNEDSGLVLSFYSRLSSLVPEDKEVVDCSIDFQDGAYALNVIGRRTVCPEKVRELIRNYDRSTKTPFQYAVGAQGEVRLNSSTALCMCHSRMALRVFDRKGEFTWEEQDHLRGHCVLMIHDINGDEVDEIILYQNDHGMVSLFIFSRKTI